MTAESVSDLRQLLRLEAPSAGVFVGRIPMSSLGRAFGGLVMGQSVMAAAATVPADRPVHSLRAVFLRTGEIGCIEYRVQDAFTGRRHATRQVDAVQGDRVIAQISISFQREVETVHLRHQGRSPSRPDFTSAPTLAELTARDPAAWPGPIDEWGAIDLREVSRSTTGASQWALRTRERIDAQQHEQVAMLAYTLDMSLLSVVLEPFSMRSGDARVALTSLDHVMWIHHPFDLSEWLLSDQVTHWVGSGRGLSQCVIRDETGRPVATAAQEGRVRLADSMRKTCAKPLTSDRCHM